MVSMTCALTTRSTVRELTANTNQMMANLASEADKDRAHQLEMMKLLMQSVMPAARGGA